MSITLVTFIIFPVVKERFINVHDQTCVVVPLSTLRILRFVLTLFPFITFLLEPSCVVLHQVGLRSNEGRLESEMLTHELSEWSNHVLSLI